MAQKYNEDEKLPSFRFSMLKRSFSYLKPYPCSFLFLFLFGVCSTICFLVFTKILGKTLDILLVSSSYEFLYQSVFWLLFVLLIGSIFQFFRGKILIQVKTKISIQLRNDLFYKLARLPQRYYDETPHGKIYTRVSQYVEHITYVLCEVFLDLILQVFTFLIVFVFLIYMNVGLTIVTTILVSLFLIFYLFLTPKLLKLRKIYQNKEANISAYLSETLKGIKISQAFLMEKNSDSVYESLMKESYSHIIPITFIGNISWSLGHIFENLTIILVYILGFAFYYPALSIGSIIVFGSYTSCFWNPITQITNQYGSIIQAIDYLGRVYDLLNYEEEKSGNEDFIIPNGEVCFQHVSFSYTPKKEVLHDLSMKFPSKKKIAIVGHTGSGKSTIIQLITRLYEQKKGTILIDGQDIQKMSLNSLRSQVMTMSQDGFLFSKSIYDNLVLAKKDISFEKVRKICKSIHIDDFIMGLEKGYDTIVEGNGSNFSTGQKQMLCIARILIQNPKIAILDEATSNVDVLTEQMIVNTFFEVFKNKTTIVIAHRLSTIVNSDLIFVMDHGHFIEYGTHQELMEKKGKYYDLYQSQTAL